MNLMMFYQIIVIIETILIGIMSSVGNFFLFLSAKLGKNLLGVVDDGHNIELVRLKKKGIFLEEVSKKKNKRMWALTSPSHVKHSKQLKLDLVYLSSRRAITTSDELINIIKQGWKDGVNHHKDLLAEFVEEWEQDEEGRLYPKKFKEGIIVDGVSIAHEHIEEVVKFFEPYNLYSHIENETTARFLSRTYGFDAKTFISTFLGVLLAIVIAYVIIKSVGVNPDAIANAVKGVVGHTAQNVTVIKG